MARQVKEKELINTRLANTYGGWVYCTNCNKNIGYLCYVTYDQVKFNYECHCGSKGSLFISFSDKESSFNNSSLVLIKNRFCCPLDQSPLFTVLNQAVKNYQLELSCINCEKTYKQEVK